MEALFHILVDNIVVGNRSLASCCTLDHFGGVSLGTDGDNFVGASRALTP